MAAYFHQNPEINGQDGLQTLVLMNPGYVQYANDAPPPGSSSNLVFLNSAHMTQPPPPNQHTQQFVGIPLSAAQDHHNAVHLTHEISPLHGMIPRVQYNLWNPVVEQQPSPTPARDTRRASQGGLSLSLSSQQQQQPPPPHPPQPAASGGGGGSPSSASVVTNNGGGGGVVPGIQGVLLSSKYLKVAQELLDEVVNVGSGMVNKAEASKKDVVSGHDKASGESSSLAAGKEGKGGAAAATELSTAERQEVQMKKAKLINMLDEVEQRYRQYHHQMQIVISSFEQAAGIGSAKSYTALALMTISKQFRCLKDAIAGQIKAANKSLGEDMDGSAAGPGKGEGSTSRLKFVDHHIRQQRALQQLGMIQHHNAWRPQRGLPERSVSILRAWLFEHFLHPYPKDSDKHMLAKQTGLTRSQVSNWFINARVRLWKPMVEEMYTEEMKEHEQNNGMDDDGKARTKSIDHYEDEDDDSASKSSSPSEKGKSFKSKEITDPTAQHDAPSMTPNSVSTLGGNYLSAPPGFALIGSGSELEGIPQVHLKRPRSTESLEGINMVGGPANFIGSGFGQYPMGEIGRYASDQPFIPSPTFAGGNGVSLTLGLPHAENLSLSMDHRGHHSQGFIPGQTIDFSRRVEVGEGNGFGVIGNSSNTTGYESINIQDRKRFVAQLLPDFVA